MANTVNTRKAVAMYSLQEESTRVTCDCRSSVTAAPRQSNRATRQSPTDSTHPHIHKCPRAANGGSPDEGGQRVVGRGAAHGKERHRQVPASRHNDTPVRSHQFTVTALPGPGLPRTTTPVS
ncbi:MAG: hypothetical protein ACPIOQ_43205, partial [Promethearchaeia archaeon]